MQFLFSLSEVSDPETLLLITNLVNLGRGHRVCTEATFRGVTYKRDMTVCVDKNEHKFILCTIDEILVNGSNKCITFVGLQDEVKYIKNFGVF